MRGPPVAAACSEGEMKLSEPLSVLDPADISCVADSAEGALRSVLELRRKQT